LYWAGGDWWLVAGGWFLVAGFWFSGFWLLVAGVGGWNK
jgi:hypothetical protein